MSTLLGNGKHCQEPTKKPSYVFFILVSSTNISITSKHQLPIWSTHFTSRRNFHYPISAKSIHVYPCLSHLRFLDFPSKTTSSTKTSSPLGPLHLHLRQRREVNAGFGGLALLAFHLSLLEPRINKIGWSGISIWFICYIYSIYMQRIISIIILILYSIY